MLLILYHIGRAISGQSILRFLWIYINISCYFKLYTYISELYTGSHIQNLFFNPTLPSVSLENKTARTM
uniref:Uncharacterized protein n=1 Tax=Onchocerca volvulus TaxID=6282 RepID=A0A8R1XPD8_ONCVO